MNGDKLTFSTLFYRPSAWRLTMLAVAVLGVAWMIATRPGDDAPPIAPAPRQDAPAPAFTATTVDGGPVALSDYAGQIVVLNMWATWCSPCRAEMPDLERVWQRYRDDGVVILAVNQGESGAKITSFRDEFGLTFPLISDREERIGRLYQLDAYPTTFFIGRDGVIRRVVYGGPMPEAFIESAVQDMLEEE